ncbi:MAG: GerAB/ArcD/ProY family transporter, partial [Desulfocucumaceae bacterium]
ILRAHPDMNIVEITADTMGNIVGTIINLMYALFFISVAAIFTRTFSEALVVTALPITPISIITIGYIAVAILGAYIGVEAVARSARVTYPFMLAGIAILLLGLIPKWDINQLFPILGNGPVKVFLEGGRMAGAVTEILLAAVIVKSFHGPEMFRKIAVRAMLMGFGYLTILLLVLVLTFGWNMAQEETLPFYSLSRLIYLGRFFQRLESIFIIIWGYIGMIKIVLTLYASALTLAGTFRLPDHRPLIWPLALIIFMASLLPPDLPTAELIEGIYIRMFTWIPTVALPLMVLAVSLLRKRSVQKGVKN